MDVILDVERLIVQHIIKSLKDILVVVLFMMKVLVKEDLSVFKQWDHMLLMHLGHVSLYVIQ